MNLKQLHQFVAIVDAGSLPRAAVAIHTAQPALSSLLAQMETELETRLMVQTRQGVAPTGADERLYRHARAILRQFEEASADIRHAADSVSGRVSIGLPASTALLAMPLLKNIHPDYPDIHLEIFASFSGYLSELLLNNRLNLALLMTNTKQKGIDAAPLLTESLYLVSRVPPEDPALPPLPRPSICEPWPDTRLFCLAETTAACASLSNTPSIKLASRFPSWLISIPFPPCSKPSARAWPTSFYRCAPLGPPHQEREAFVLQKLTHPGIRRSLQLCRPKGVPVTAAIAIVTSLLVNKIKRLLPTGVWGDAQSAWSGAESGCCPRRWRDRCGTASGICPIDSDKNPWPKIANMIRHGSCTARALG